MAIRSFVVGPVKGLQHAAAEDLPNLVVVAGPNGSGKSTLLHQLWERREEFAEQGTEVSYVGPHRPWRKSTLAMAHLFEMPFAFHQYLEMGTIPGWQMIVPQGLQSVANQPRLPDSVDEAYSMVKFSIAKLEQKRLQLLQRTYKDHGDMIPQGALPDIFNPLKRLTEFLLPHLSFSEVDLADDRDIKVFFSRNDGDVQGLIDIDDLSSGEKAIVALFLPFLEREMEVLMGDSQNPEGRPLATAIIDEPDIHLHPTLQVSLVDYIRELASSGLGQFIIATHSPTILDSLQEDELYLLAPVSSVGDGNQFLRITSSAERLESIRSLTGSTHMVTRCRPIVYIEGQHPESRGVSDQRLIELLLPEAASWVLVSSGGRHEVVRSAASLREAATEHLPGIPVFALVDADQDEEVGPDYVISWPVAMVENLLLDPEAIWALLSPHRERLTLASSGDVRRSLQEISQGLSEEEISLRAQAELKPIRVELAGESTAAAMIAAARRDFEDALSELGGETAIAAVSDRARRRVDRILEESQALERFRGKRILHTFQDRYCGPLAMSRKTFAYELARRVREHPRLNDLVATPVRKITRFVPPGLVPALEGSVAALQEHPIKEAAIEALENARIARIAWEAGEPDEIDRTALRTTLFRLARELSDRGASDLHATLLENAVELGG